MKPVVTPAEMNLIDAEAEEPVEMLIERAGWATARAAIEILVERGGVYGARVAVLAGKGNNGADGRRAAHHLEGRGARCLVFEVPPVESAAGSRPGGYDLVIDAAFGTGLRGQFWSSQLPIEIGGSPVLAVDIPSGVNGLTGEAQGRPLPATRTVTFAAAKPGLLFEPGRSLAGDVEVADIGLDCSRANLHLLERSDLDGWPSRAERSHKWNQAVAVIGGSPGMEGAASLAATAAFRAGAGYVVRAQPGSQRRESEPVEAVSISLADDYGRAAGLISRCSAVVVGPGLAIDDETQSVVARVLADIEAPLVMDAGALQPDLLAEVVSQRNDTQPLPVFTPHDGEFTRLTGRSPGSDRVADTRQAATELGAVVVLKGPTTVIAHPDGRALISVAGDQRLATAGTGDVLAGTIGAGLALGLDPLWAAGLGVELHGQAATLGPAVGLTAGDLPNLISATLSR